MCHDQATQAVECESPVVAREERNTYSYMLKHGVGTGSPRKDRQHPGGRGKMRLLDLAIKLETRVAREPTHTVAQSARKRESTRRRSRRVDAIGIPTWIARWYSMRLPRCLCAPYPAAYLPALDPAAPALSATAAAHAAVPTATAAAPGQRTSLPPAAAPAAPAAAAAAAAQPALPAAAASAAHPAHPAQSELLAPCVAEPCPPGPCVVPCRSARCMRARMACA